MGSHREGLPPRPPAKGEALCNLSIGWVWAHLTHPTEMNGSKGHCPWRRSTRQRLLVGVRGGRPGDPLSLETLEVDGPREGEVLVEIKATGICHTDEYTLSGADPEGLFPAVLGHEGAGIVVDVGPGVTTLKKGDHVIPLYMPECRQCKSCLSRKT